MEDRKIRVAITHGDTNGIGYEVILKAFEDPEMLELCTPIIYGSPKVATAHRKAMEIETQFSVINSAENAKDNKVNLLAAVPDEIEVKFGQPTEESAEAARKAMAKAKEDLQKGLYDVLVTAPVVPAGGPVREEKALTMMVCEHVSLRRDFRISNPRLAILALNPQMGNEEEEVIKPAVDELEKSGVQAFGPYLADTFFGDALYLDFDGVLAMYDDQGTVPFRSIAQEYGVKLKAGISAIVVTPDHGPAFDIAGKGVADEQSLRHAIYTAIDMYRHRAEYDEPLANPLPKLYHEKREDGEKARFAIKAKDQFKTPPEK